MANTFGILAALVLAFSAFVAFKNKEEFETQNDNVKSEENNLDRNNKSFTALKAEIKGLEEETSTANTSRDEFNEKLTEQNTKNKGVSDTISAKEADLAATKKRVADAEDTLKDLGEIKDLAPKIERLQATITELEDQVAILNAENSRLRAAEASTKLTETKAKKRLSDINSGRSLVTMKTSVRSISTSLGFVTLSGGMKAGVIGGSKVAVMRGGEKIAELNVTAVSANTSTADIVQSSLAEGVEISIGDTVVPNETVAE